MSSIDTNIAYSLDDLCIIPASMSEVSSRTNCNPYYRTFAYTLDSKSEMHETLPIFTAPMPSVVNGNVEIINNYLNNNITPVIPRSVDFKTRRHLCTEQKLFVAFSLNETQYFIDNKDLLLSTIIPYKICIDVANGNMKSLVTRIQKLKEIYGNMILIMSGNVANYQSYKNLAQYGCDFIRLSIGTGSACTTATNTGIYMPMATLIYECANAGYSAKIIADGGINSYRNIIKALAVGADYVMLGGMLNKLSDSPGQVAVSGDGKKYKIHFGMASIEGQKALGKEQSMTPPEGKMIYQEMENKTINEFSKEFSHYLRSAMSYCGRYDIDNFARSDMKLRVMSWNAARQYNQSREDLMPSGIGNAQIIL